MNSRLAQKEAVMTSTKSHQSSVFRIVLRTGPVALAVVLALMWTGTQAAGAQTLNVVYSFSGGADGSQPYAQLVPDGAGNAYGTTAVGGDLSACGGSGCGVVFKVSRSGQYTVIYSFNGGADGANPWSGLLRDNSGNLYGTTEAGGASG